MLLVACAAIFAFGLFGTMIAQTVVISRAKYSQGNLSAKDRRNVVYVDHDGNELSAPMTSVKQNQDQPRTPVTIEGVKVSPVVGLEVSETPSAPAPQPSPSSVYEPSEISQEVLQSPAILRTGKLQNLQELRRSMGFKSALEELLEQEAKREQRLQKRRAARAKKKPKTEAQVRPLTPAEEAEHTAQLQEEQLKDVDKGSQPPLR